MILTSKKNPGTEVQEAERLLVGLGPYPAANNLIRTVKEMADNVGSEWFAVYVEDPGMLRQPEKVRNQAVSNLRLAEELGAETVTLRGSNIAREIINFARRIRSAELLPGSLVVPVGKVSSGQVRWMNWCV